MTVCRATVKTMSGEETGRRDGVEKNAGKRALRTSRLLSVRQDSTSGTGARRLRRSAATGRRTFPVVSAALAN